MAPYKCILLLLLLLLYAPLVCKELNMNDRGSPYTIQVFSLCLLSMQLF